MKKVLILGAGYASIALLKSLPEEIFKEAEITLISQEKYHYTTILLHEVVSGARDKSVLFDLKEIVPNQVNIIQDTVIEVKKDIVCCQNNTYQYDYLIVGLGFSSDNFNIPGINEYALPLVNYQGAKKIKIQIEKLIIDYKNTNKRKLEIIICGAGFSGIELIASLAEELPEYCKKIGADPNGINLTCVEAMPNILPMFSKKLADNASAYLRRLGIKIAVNTKVLECQEDGIIVDKNGKQEKMPASLIIWTAGVKGNEVMANSPLFTTKRCRVEVNDYLKPINQDNQSDMDNIFVFGDCSVLKDKSTDKFYPQTAQISEQEGEYLGKVLLSHLKGEKNIKPFKYNFKGTLCSLGCTHALGIIGKTNELTGKIAMYLKLAIEAVWRFKVKGLKGVFNGK